MSSDLPNTSAHTSNVASGFARVPVLAPAPISRAACDQRPPGPRTAPIAAVRPLLPGIVPPATHRISAARMPCHSRCSNGAPPPPAVQVQQSLLQKLPGSISTSIPPNDQLGILGGAYAALALWAFIQGATEPYAVQQADVAGLQLALGFGGAVYFMRDRKRLGLGRAFGYATLGLVLGATIGNLLEGWLRVDIVPILGMGSPGVFVGEFGLLGLALAAAVLA